MQTTGEPPSRATAPDEDRTKRVPAWSAARTTLLYVAVGLCWIVMSTTLVFTDAGMLGLSPRTAELIKGLAFVAVTGAALWVVTHRFERSLRAGEAARRETLQRRLDVTDAEQARLARDVHDSAIQLLAAASLRLEAATASDDWDNVATARELLGDGIGALRRIILELEPPDLTAGDLEPIIEAYATHLLGREGVDVRVEIDLPPRLDHDVLTAIYRILVEALSNAARHADPDHVSVRLAATGDTIIGQVVDDGGGIPADAPSGPGHLGLESMQERTERLGGRLELHPRDASGGTSITFRRPLERRADAAGDRA